MRPEFALGIGRLAEPPPSTRPAISARSEGMPGQNAGNLFSVPEPPLGLGWNGNMPTAGGACEDIALLDRHWALAGTCVAFRKVAVVNTGPACCTDISKLLRLL